MIITITAAAQDIASSQVDVEFDGLAAGGLGPGDKLTLEGSPGTHTITVRCGSFREDVTTNQSCLVTVRWSIDPPRMILTLQ